MELSYDQALYRAAALCTKSEHCEFDIAQKLNSWGISPADNHKIISYLKQEKYLDNARYCQFFVKDKSKFNKWGKRKIETALRAKHLEPELIKNALEEINSDETLSLLEDLLRAKLRNLKYKNNYDRYGKLLRFAASRGFEVNLISRAIQNLNLPPITEEE